MLIFFLPLLHMYLRPFTVCVHWVLFVCICIIILYAHCQYSDWIRAGQPGDRIPVGARFFAHVQTGPGAHPASCTMGTGSLPRVKQPGRGADHPPPCSAKVKKGKSYTSFQLLGQFRPVTGLLYLYHWKEQSLPCNENQPDALFIFNLIHQSASSYRRNDQHYALIYTTPLFYILAPTCFGSSLPSSWSLLGPSELVEIQIK
jgi:hypothetical protein